MHCHVNACVKEGEMKIAKVEPTVPMVQVHKVG